MHLCNSLLLSRLRPDILRDTESSSSTVEGEQLTKVEVEQLTKVEVEQTKACNTGPAEDPGRRSYRRLLGVSLCVTNIGYILADLSCQVVARVEASILTRVSPGAGGRAAPVRGHHHAAGRGGHGGHRPGDRAARPRQRPPLSAQRDQPSNISVRRIQYLFCLEAVRLNYYTPKIHIQLKVDSFL